MRSRVSHIVFLVGVGAFLLLLPSLASGQHASPHDGLEISVTAHGVRTAGSAFGWAGGGAATTVSAAYPLKSEFDIRWGITVAAVEPDVMDLLGADGAGLALPWLPDTKDEYVSVSVGSSYWLNNKNSRLAPFVGGKLSFVKRTRDEPQTGWEIGATTGARLSLTRHVGLEFAVGASIVRLYNAQHLQKGSLPDGGPYTPKSITWWRTGHMMMLGAGLVYRL